MQVFVGRQRNRSHRRNLARRTSWDVEKKYVLNLGDGAADRAVFVQKRVSMQAFHTPLIDSLSRDKGGRRGFCLTSEMEVQGRALEAFGATKEELGAGSAAPCSRRSAAARDATREGRALLVTLLAHSSNPRLAQSSV